MKKISQIIQWFFAVSFALMSFSTGSIVSGIIVFIAAVLMAPIKPIREILQKIKIKSVVAIILSVVLLFVGVLISPSSEEPSNTSGMSDELLVDDENTTERITESTTESTTETATESTTESTTETTTEEETTTEKHETTTKKTETTTNKKETTTKKTETTTKKENTTKKETKITYVLNTSTMKFHLSTCRDVSKIKDENYGTYKGTRDEVIDMGYSPCGHCHP